VGAIYGGQLEAVRMLLRHGLVLEGGVAECELVAACESSNIEIVALLLEHAPATAKDECGETALMAATRSMSLEIMRMLLERGAEVHARVRRWIYGA
jgi:ankyrin repeat protein